ncbi:SpoIIE family protein phosphatase [Nocardioides taihuensis]|uniref:SpoIIE family protein phosphatase n=1 Tax=Nocardioides taihuensis TaxID=1835606 RepID=A0ABW0BGG2_9ACTN
MVPHGGGDFGSVEAALAAFEDEPQICVVVEGVERRVVAANAAARARLGGGGIGDVVSDATTEALGLGDPHDLETVRRTGDPDFSSHWHVRVGAGGRAQDVLLHRSLVPWVGADGSVRGVVAVVSDVTTTLPAGRRREPGGRARHDAMVSLSDALLPDDLPVVPGLDVAARYLLASEDGAAGGDWFDVVVRDDGRVVLVVGDVVGHGVTASAVMGQLRAVLHERLASGASVDEAVADLDRFARTRPESRATTLVVVEVDPAGGDICYCTAGHPPPLVVDAEGRATFLPPSGGAPLGTVQPAAAVASARLRPDDLVLLHSDGLLERRGGSHAHWLTQVADVFSHAYLGLTGATPGAPRRTVERVCQEGLEVLARLEEGHDEDITVVAAQRVSPLAPLTLRLPAVRSSVATVREELHGWLARVDSRPLDEMSVQHAVGELVTNVVEHAYAGRLPGDVRVTMRQDPRGELVAEVADDGCWHDRPPGDPGRTHGLALARGLVDSLLIEGSETGTTVTARARLSRPAQLLQGRVPQAHPVAASRFRFGAHPGDDRRIDVGGSLDASNADELRASARRATAGGTRPLVLDLAGVTHLGSAAVQALHEVVAEGPAPPRLQAPRGSVAQQVMELVRLPHSTSPADPAP